MNSVTKGDAFRDLVADLLRTQFQNVQVEDWINGTKVDITFLKEDFGRSLKYAVECKDYSDPLTKSYISTNIYPLYKPMLDTKSMDRILIVSKKPLGAAANEYVESWATHQTYSELAEALIGFRAYVESLSNLQPTPEGTPYVEARLEGKSGNALADVESWITSGGLNSVAILGGYGQGKTSFARRVAAEHAKQYLRDPTNRIPILLKLGEVVHETQLEGLFGKEFTAKHRVRGYNFQALDLLNRQGRLLIILDGFDEMKHAMTAADFQANFQEFNRLLCDNSKVLLLGRPNALPSDERELVFRGRRRVGDQYIQSSNFTAWQEWQLAFFNEDETKALLHSNLSSLMTKYSKNGVYCYPTNFLVNRIDEILAKVPSDLLRRPVHVALIAEVGADPNFDLNDFDEFRLYKHFIRSMVERDTRDKPARRVISLEPRLQFQRELAWWAWHRVGSTQGCFYRTDVPIELFSGLPEGNSVDDEGKRNEYIVSTLTEEKESGILFFAHRSFQEFLVAERMITAATSPNIHIAYSAFFTPDVINFLSQVPETDSAYVIAWHETLRSCPGPVSPEYLEFFSHHPRLIAQLSKDFTSIPAHEIDPYTIIISGLIAKKGGIEIIGGSKYLRQLIKLVLESQPLIACAATLVLLEHIPTRPTLQTLLIATLISRCLQMRKTDKNDLTTLIVDAKKADFSTDWLGNMLKKIHPKVGEVTPMELSFSRVAFGNRLLMNLCEANLLAKDSVLNAGFFYFGNHTKVTVKATQVFDEIEKRLRESNMPFLASKTEKFKVVPIRFVTPRYAGGGIQRL